MKIETRSNREDIVAIIQAAENYAFGVAEKNWTQISQAYDAPKAQMKLITGEPGSEKVYVLPISDVWEKIWSQLPDADQHKVEITHISVREGRVATVEMNNNGRFYDQLGLYKVDGKWRIYDKLTRLLDGGHIPENDLELMFGRQE